VTTARQGKLAPVVFVDPTFLPDDVPHEDEHPPSDIQLGEGFLSQVVDALRTSPQWPHTALFITWDENGGLYDHVAPPPACPPGDLAAQVPPGESQADFDRYGFRVPLIVVSPYAKPHYVGHRVYDHSSILRFVEARFRLPAFTGRDANAEPPFDLFDFSRPQLLNPPALPAPALDQAKLADCEARYGSTQ
jgi:phospholipase C